MLTRFLLPGALLLSAAAQPPASADGAGLLLSPASFAQESPADTPDVEAEPTPSSIDAPRELRFGEPGAWHWGAGAGVGLADDSTDLLGYARFGTFLTEGLEFNINLQGYAFLQDPGVDTGGAGFAIDFRWHFLRRESYSVYGLAGIGVLGAFDDVPQDGTEFNFTPTVGLGSTIELGGGPTRLDLGLRWHHISNATFRGSDDNPARDGVMVYLGVVVPF